MDGGLTRQNAHLVSGQAKQVLDAVWAGDDAVKPLDLARRFGKAAVEKLIEQGHIAETLEGHLVVTPLTLRELNGYRPWSSDEDAALTDTWATQMAIREIATSLGRAGGDVLQRAWALNLERRKAKAVEDFDAFVPSWRVRRLRLALVDAEQRGANRHDNGDDLEHRALKRRFEQGRSISEAEGLPENHGAPWSTRDTAALEELRCGGKTIATLARIFQRTEVAVLSKVNELGISRIHFWSLEEDQIVAAGVAARQSNNEILKTLKAAGFKRTKRGLKSRVHNLGLCGSRAFRPWTPHDRQRVRDVFTKGESVKDLAVELDRPKNGVRYQARVMGLVHPDSTMVKTFTEAEDEIIRKGWKAGTPPKDIVAQLPNRTLHSVYTRAWRLGVTGEASSFRRRVKPSEISKIAEIAANNGSADAAAAAVGRTKQAVQRIASRYNISFSRKRGTDEGTTG